MGGCSFFWVCWSFHFFNFISAKIDRNSVNTAYDFHKEGLLASASVSIEADDASNDAVFFFERAVRLEPRNATLWHDLGVAQMRIKKWENADDCFLATMTLLEKKIKNGGSSESIKRAVKVYNSAKENRAEITAYIEALERSNSLLSVVRKFKSARTYSRLLSGRSVGVLYGLVDDFNNEIEEEEEIEVKDGKKHDDILKEIISSCKVKEEYLKSIYNQTPFIPVIPAMSLSSTFNKFVDHYYTNYTTPLLLQLFDLSSWKTKRYQKSSTNSATRLAVHSQWWRAWSPSYLGINYGHLIIFAKIGTSKIHYFNHYFNHSSLSLSLSSSLSSLSSSNCNLTHSLTNARIRMTLVEAIEEIDILSKMVSFSNLNFKQTIEKDKTPIRSLRSHLLHRLGISSTVQALLLTHSLSNTQTPLSSSSSSSSSSFSLLFPSIVMDVGLPLDEWSHIKHELGKLPPHLGRDQEDVLLMCLIRISLSKSEFEHLDISNLSAATLPIISDFMIWSKWRKLSIITLGDYSASFDQQFDIYKNRAIDDDKIVLFESISDWYLQVSGKSRWILCRHRSIDLYDIHDDDENCYKACITGGEYIYLPPEWFVASVIAESSSASIILSGHFIQERSDSKITLRKVIEVMAKVCVDDNAKSYNSDTNKNNSVVKVSEQVCALLYRASQSC